jgi:hypothetical protein
MKKIIISRRALVARINRKVAHDSLALRVNRSYGRGNLGELFFINLHTGNIDEKTYWLSDWKHLESFGREIGLLQKHEVLE